MAVLLSVSVTLLAGLLMSRLAKVLKLPAVTAYIIAGILIGPFCLGALPLPEGIGFSSIESVESFKIITEVATGFIAFSIGNEFRLSALKKTGKQATVIGILQAVAATLVVDAALIGLHFIMPDKISLPAAVTLGAIASATAPAATLMVVNQYKAKGPLTDLLLPIVALDDAVGLIIFAVSFGIAKSMVSGGALDFISVIVEPLLEVILSLLLGAIMGFIFHLTERFFHSRSKRMSISIAFVLLTVALTTVKFEIGGVHIGFSTLLTCMMLGTVFCNICDVSEEIMDRTERWTAPLYVMFFALSGAELDFSAFADVAIVGIGVVYIIARSLGKYFGTFGSSKLVKCEPTVNKFLGITLLPQAGVALGMSLTALELGKSDGTLVRNIVLFSVLIYELVGPMLTKMALQAAGEIKPEGKKSSRGATDMAGGRRHRAKH
ncbi:MAG: sodium:proton antiporter [Ruminococcaceae bacterium]|nr:sodium:proton antiporter [Oscillospiraceae bacterium]